MKGWMREDVEMDGRMDEAGIHRLVEESMGGELRTCMRDRIEEAREGKRLERRITIRI